MDGLVKAVIDNIRVISALSLPAWRAGAASGLAALDDVLDFVRRGRTNGRFGGGGPNCERPKLRKVQIAQDLGPSYAPGCKL
jgi:hypothetical protein